MEELSAQGIVIHEKPSGEADKIITVLTAEHGKVCALAKGVRNLSNKNAAACQLFVYSEYQFVTKGNRRILKTALSKDVFFGMRSDAERFSLVSYFAEILGHVTMENNDETQTLRLFLNVVYAISNKTDIPLWVIKAAFELKLMCVLGFMPDFAEFGCCSNQAYLSKSNIFSFEQGALLCEKCCSESRRTYGSVPYSCTLPQDVVRAMIYICKSETKKILSFKLDTSYSNELAFVCENYLIHKTERSYETLKIYKSIVNSLKLINTEKNEEQK